MKHKDSPFEITNTILRYVSEISELSGRLHSMTELSHNPTLRRTNRIRTIYGSLAIEQNALSLDQVTAVLNGKRVLAPPKDIAEVKNAYEIYERLNELNPYSVDDLLTAHSIMTRDLIDESGMFRSRPVGVVDQSGNVLHFGTLPQYVPDLVMQLLEWTEDSDLPMLIRSCVFHYEFELIHPFMNGNGRVGRLWHTLLLSQWNPAFAWLSIESLIHDHQQEYYDAINTCNNAGTSTVFIEFMLSIIKTALLETIGVDHVRTASCTPKNEARWAAVQSFLQLHPFIMNADVQALLHVSSATANRILTGFEKENKLERCREKSHWAYRLK